MIYRVIIDKMKQPKISVIVPCFKVEKYLDRCLESLVNQTLSEIEIILVDDLSPDNTPALCDKWAAKDDRIKVVHKEVNEGLGMARNTGLKVATGEYVMFLDSDDTFELDACQRMYDSAFQMGADAVCGNFITEIRPGVWREEHDYDHDVVMEAEEIIRYLLDVIASEPHVESDRLHPVSVCLMCMKRTVIIQNKLSFLSEREVASEDTLFKIDFLKCCKKVISLDFPFYHYFHNGASLSHTFNASTFDNLKTLRVRLVEIAGNIPGSMPRIDRFIISDIRSHITRLVQSEEKCKIGHVKRILDDEIWLSLKHFKPTDYKGYSRWFHRICIWNHPYLLIGYTWAAVNVRNLLMRVKNG